MVVVPFVCGLIAIGLESWDHFERVNDAALMLATCTLVAVVIRMALVFSENQAMITHSRDEARTDALTGLRNRRSLMGDLEAEMERATLEAPAALILFDLDGFKEYNDAFGHPAGDGLLARLGERLEDAVRGCGRAYRLGGDEFCVLAHPGAAGAEAVVAASLVRPERQGRGLRDHRLARGGDDPAGRGDRRGLAPARRQAHVRPQGRPPHVRRASDPRRAAQHPLRAPARPLRAPARRGRPGHRAWRASWT